MSTHITDLRFGWQPQGPLLVGYGYAFFAGGGADRPRREAGCAVCQPLVAACLDPQLAGDQRQRSFPQCGGLARRAAKARYCRDRVTAVALT